MTHGSLFSGIGGFDLAAEWMGWENKFHCEINPFGRKILNYYWPNAECYEDITKTDFTIWRGRIDVLSGGFPCQPFSVAGKRKGKDDDRYLWPEMLRAIREIKPRWIVGENVYGLVNWNGGAVFNDIQNEMEAEGYKVWTVLLPALAIDANNLRERIWFIAYSDQMGWEDVQSEVRSSSNKICHLQGNRSKIKRREKEANKLGTSGNSFLQFQEMYSEPPVFNVDDELPFKLDGITVPKWIQESLSGLGNAINPEVVYQLFKTIQHLSTLSSFL